jgi:hypothetical protein
VERGRRGAWKFRRSSWSRAPSASSRSRRSRRAETRRSRRSPSRRRRDRDGSLRSAPLAWTSLGRPLSSANETKRNPRALSWGSTARAPRPSGCDLPAIAKHDDSARNPHGGLAFATIRSTRLSASARSRNRTERARTRRATSHASSRRFSTTGSSRASICRPELGDLRRPHHRSPHGDGGVRARRVGSHLAWILLRLGVVAARTGGGPDLGALLVFDRR